VSLTWKQGLAIGGGVMLAGGAAYGLWRYLLPRVARINQPPAPTNVTARPRIVSARNATLAVSATSAVASAAGGPPVVAKWYHYYLQNGQLFPRLIATTPAVGSDLAFTFGVTSQAGKIIDPVTPGRPYTWGVQVCVGGSCSPIVRVQTQIPAYKAA